MKAIVHTAANRLEMQDVPRPEPGAGQVRIRTGACGICATDLAMIAGWERTSFGAIPGHEWSGVVDAAGPGAGVPLVGRRCVAENVLADGGEVGFEHAGGYAEYFLTEAANVHPLPPDLPFEPATLIEPLAVCVRGLRRLEERAPRRTLVMGDGPIGLLLVLLLTGRGGEVILVGGREARLRVARELGAEATFDYHVLADDWPEAVGPVSTVVEASGSPVALKAAINLVRGGKILVVGDYGTARADFAWNTILHREIALVGSNASAGAWPEAVRLAVENRSRLERLVTHALPAARFREGFDLLRDRNSGAIKVVLQWMA
jgi:threonine dehydrogenase-like Zn-dependent dehydrogenase